MLQVLTAETSGSKIFLGFQRRFPSRTGRNASVYPAELQFRLDSLVTNKVRTAGRNPGKVFGRRRNGMAPPRIILADDHTLVVEALRRLLETQCNIVGTVSDGLALMKAASALKPDVIVADIVMPLLSGLEAGRQIKTLMPTIKLIFITMNEDPDLAIEAMRERASGYLLKSSAASELFQAVQVALKGGSYVTPRIAKGMQEGFIKDPEAKLHTKRLTARQRQVIQLLAEGKSMKEAAAILNLTPRTIAFHKYRVMEQLGFKNTASLIEFAIKNHILIG